MAGLHKVAVGTVHRQDSSTREATHHNALLHNSKVVILHNSKVVILHKEATVDRHSREATPNREVMVALKEATHPNKVTVGHSKASGELRRATTLRSRAMVDRHRNTWAFRHRAMIREQPRKVMPAMTLRPSAKR